MKAGLMLIVVLIFVIDIFYVTDKLAETTVRKSWENPKEFAKNVVQDVLCLMSLGAAFLLTLIF